MPGLRRLRKRAARPGDVPLEGNRPGGERAAGRGRDPRPRLRLDRGGDARIAARAARALSRAGAVSGHFLRLLAHARGELDAVRPALDAALDEVLEPDAESSKETLE